MPIHFLMNGTSGSFPDGAPDLSGNGCIFAGDDAGRAYQTTIVEEAFCAIELRHELLAEHLGLDPAPVHERTVGFARFRMGSAAPGNLIELVRLPWADPSAVDAARLAFESGGFVVAVCADMPGRIVNKLIRPYLNAVLRRLDDGLASAKDMDTTLRLGLGYPEGPHAMLERTGLVDHFEATQALYVMTGDPDLAPARRARVAAQRADK
jgi:3-hydroxybutyryl-CoA dehydrogenase